MELSLQELADAYCEEPTDGLRSAILTEAMPLVKSIIGKVSRPDTPLSQYEDIKSAGVMGLLQALNKYDCSKEIQFNTFAYYRIRGNIIDYLRSIDQLPRNDRSLFGKAQQAINTLQQKLGRDPDDHEVADYLDIHVEDYEQLLSNVQYRAVLSLDSPAYRGESNESMAQVTEDYNAEMPSDQIEKQEISQHVKKAIKKLNDRERLILALYYYEDLTLKEIGQLLDITEARVSQIVGKLLMKLKRQVSNSS